MTCRLTTMLIACLALPLPALGWDLHKQRDSVTTSQFSGQYILTMHCRRGSNQLEFNLHDQTLRGDLFQGVRTVMMWIKAPDGRMDKWSSAVSPEGPSLSGLFEVSSYTLDFFGNAKSMSIVDTSGSRRVLFESDMKGTGAARIAFRERCGV